MATVQELCKDLGAGDQVKAYQARKALLTLAGEAGAKGKETARKELAAALAIELKATQPKKDSRGEPTESSLVSTATATDLCRVLSIVAGDAEVPVLRDCLNNIDLREIARWTLERMTCQGATDVLVEAAKTLAGQEFRVGLLNALARKNGSNVIAVLKECAAERDPQIQLAAAESLATLGDAASDEVIAAIGKVHGGFKGQNRVNSRIARARLRLAGAVAKAGEKDAAKKILTAVAAGPADDVQTETAKENLARL